MLDNTTAERLARMALGHIEQEYPNHIMHRMNGRQDARTPCELHPIFFGSFDWHSCVHSYWLLARLLQLFPALDQADDIRSLFRRRINAGSVADELRYFETRPGFERPYGWAWLLQLVVELSAATDGDARAAGNTLAPLAVFIARRFVDYWPIQTYAIRTGTHANSAFAAVMAWDYACAHPATGLADVLRDQARAWFAADRSCPAWGEPGGDEFLSPALIEALCMHRILAADEFAEWFDRFLPDLAQRSPATLFVPAQVSDRSDGKIAHLDGLNLSRAWCKRLLAGTQSSARREILLHSARIHIDSAMPHLETDYMGSHWLATFALLALDDNASPSGAA